MMAIIGHPECDFWLKKIFSTRTEDPVISGVGAGYAGDGSWARDIQTQLPRSQPYQ
jgi:hypothetical protein